MDKKTAKNTAKQLAQDLNGPLGPVPLERVIVKYFDFIDELRKTGATWPQIAGLLNKAGASRKDGSVIPAEQIRAIVSRNLSKAISGHPCQNTSDKLSLTKQKLTDFSVAGNQKENSTLKRASTVSIKPSVRSKMTQALKARKN